MRRRGLGSAMVLMRASICIVSVLMLLSFPAARAHAFETHFRNPEVRRAIERETSIAHTDENPQNRIAPNELLPTFFAPTETINQKVPLDSLESISEVPLPRLLNRLKLNPG